jgi:hypothetical protein
MVGSQTVCTYAIWLGEPGQSIRVVGPVVRHCEEEEEEEEEVYSSERSCAQVKEPNKRSGGSPR